MQRKKVRTVAVSGGFDPVHVGHVELFEAARKLGDRLVVILNNDNWLRKKKGSAFMPEVERKKVLEALRAVDEVILTDHEENPADMTVCAALDKLRPDVFGNGGDRTKKTTPEMELCETLGIEMAFGLGNKIQSSSWLLANYIKDKA